MAGRNCCKCVTVSLVPTASLILVILFACGIILLPILYVELSRDYKYGIIIDAGSSHTTLYGYKWRVPIENNSTGVIDVQEIYRCSEGKSLDKESANAFRKCLGRSTLYRNLPIDNALRPSMPIYLGATAGMRVLNMTNHTASDEIFVAVHAELENSNYMFRNENARIISGEEEAIGGWTTANYLDKNLNPPKETTVGSLDLGGASTQIAFQVFDDSPAHTPSELLFKHRYNLFARSYLCYGVNEAYGRFLASLINSTNQRSYGSIPNPCLMNGVNITYSHSDIYKGCVNISSQAAMEAFGFGYAPPTSLVDETGDVNFVGAWNAETCNNTINKLFDFSQCRLKTNCAPGKKFTVPPVNGSFTAFSSFYYTARYFAQNTTTFTKATGGWKAFYDAVKTNCSVVTNITTDTCIVNGKVKKNCYQNCFNGLFMLHLLENGFGFNQTAANNWSVEFQEKVDGISVGWALGYMLNQTRFISQDKYMEQRPYTAVDLVVGILILTILCVVFVIFFFLTFYACRKALRPRNGFQPL